MPGRVLYKNVGRLTVFPAIHNPPYGRRVLAHGALVAGLEVDVSDLPIHAGAEGFTAVLAKTYVHHRRAVLVRLE